MSHDDDDDYTGDRAAWLDDRAAHDGLGPRAGDEWARRRHRRYPNGRWGATERLYVAPAGPGQSRKATLVVTDLWDVPRPIAFQLRFSTDGVTYSATMPVGGGVDVTLTKSFDPKAGAADERFGIDPGFSQPMCQAIARSLTITIALAETALNDLYVQAVACPTTMVDCGEIVPPSADTPAGFDTAGTTRWPAVAADVYSLVGTDKGAYFCIVNQSNVDLFVHLGTGVTTTPGDEFATIVLPGGVSAGYEVLNYRGDITFQFAGDDGDGYALTTTGVYP